MSNLVSGNRHFAVVFTSPEDALAVDRCFFVAPYECVVQSINEVHSVVGSDGGAVNVQVTLETGTSAPGAGTDLLSNNSNAGFNLKGTVNTPQYGAFKPGASRKMARGDRLSVDFAGTQTGVVGLTITVIINRSH